MGSEGNLGKNRKRKIGFRARRKQKKGKREKKGEGKRRNQQRKNLGRVWRESEEKTAKETKGKKKERKFFQKPFSDQADFLLIGLQFSQSNRFLLGSLSVLGYLRSEAKNFHSEILRK